MIQQTAIQFQKDTILTGNYSMYTMLREIKHVASEIYEIRYRQIKKTYWTFQQLQHMDIPIKETE